MQRFNTNVVIFCALILALCFCLIHGSVVKEKSEVFYEPTWESIDSRPLPEWYDQGKIGIFIHWGVYSVPSYINEWFWWSWKSDNSPAHAQFVTDNFKPGFTYQEFAPMFTTEFYNADDWADLFQKSGAKHIVLTSKHHEGYALWPSSYGFGWNSVAVGPHRDLLGELEQAVRKTDVRFGLYYSLLEWYHPQYEADKASNWTTNAFSQLKSIPTLKEVVRKYKPDVIWSDGEWEAPDSYWKSVDFLAWLYNESPVKDTVVTNDRWGSDTRGKHGGFYNYDDRYNPGVLIPHKWENAMTLDRQTWTYRRDAKYEDFLTPEELISTIVATVACGGNVLVNVGPSKEGMIPVIMQERLLQMGEWLGINGEAIYNTVPWTVQNDTLTPGVWYTTNPTRSKIFAITTSWPGEELLLRSVHSISGMTVQMLGSTTGNLQWRATVPSGISVTMPPLDPNSSKWAWTIVINAT